MDSLHFSEYSFEKVLPVFITLSVNSDWYVNGAIVVV